MPLWPRRVQLWLCTSSVSTNVCAVFSCPVFVHRCCSPTVYPRPPGRVSSAGKYPLPTPHCTVTSQLNGVISYFCDIRLKHLRSTPAIIAVPGQGFINYRAKVGSLTITGVETIWPLAALLTEINFKSTKAPHRHTPSLHHLWERFFWTFSNPFYYCKRGKSSALLVT